MTCWNFVWSHKVSYSDKVLTHPSKSQPSAKLDSSPKVIGSPPRGVCGAKVVGDHGFAPSRLSKSARLTCAAPF